MIADTSLIIDILRGEINAKKTIEQKATFLITTPTITEIFAGLHGAGVRERNRIEQVLTNLPALPLDVESSKRAGHIQSQLKQAGNAIDLIDCMIAGIALTRNEAVMTKNVKHFERISGLAVETY